MTAEYYVLRIYRNKSKGVSDLLGVLEDAMSGNCWSFKNDDELHRVIDKVTYSNGLELLDDKR